MVLTKPKTLEPREFARPAIGTDDAMLRIEACGICGSDYEQYEGAHLAIVPGAPLATTSAKS
jgi:threonine dehydrogenase-like Zn-dependent dehydrogenase